MKYVDTDPEPHICRLCGATGLLELRPLELPDGKGGWTYESGLRCIDLAACKRRRWNLDHPSQETPDA